MWSRICFVVLFLAVFASCKTKKKINLPTTGLPTVVTEENAASIKSFELSNLDFLTFSGRAKAKIELDKKTHDANIHVRIEKDKAIWISVTAMLGVEVARILIAPDRVKILNKWQGEYIEKPFDYIYNYVNQGITFNILQDILLGNVSPNLLRTDNVQVASADDEFIVVGSLQNLSYQYRVNAENRPFNFLLQEQNEGHNLETYYGDHTVTKGYNFPHTVIFNFSGSELSLKAQVSYNKVDFNTAVEMPFSVSDRYKVIN